MIVTFRPVAAADIDRVLPYMAQLYEAGGYEEERQRKALETLIGSPDFGGAWLLEADGEVAGYLILTTGFSLEFHGRYTLVDELFVDARWRGKELGTRALAFAEEWSRARGFRAMRLEVGHHNPGALRLYRRYGFGAPDRHLLSKEI